LIGIAEMPNGKRKKQISGALEMLLVRLFSSRILPFDQQAAVSYSELLNSATSGKSLSFCDGQIAAIAIVHNFAIATSNTTTYQSLGLKTINPWASPIG
jgi:hypothetical protein